MYNVKQEITQLKKELAARDNYITHMGIRHYESIGRFTKELTDVNANIRLIMDHLKLDFVDVPAKRITTPRK